MVCVSWILSNLCLTIRKDATNAYICYYIQNKKDWKCKNLKKYAAKGDFSMSCLVLQMSKNC